MSTKVEFHAIRPFGPTILQGKLPNNLIKILDNRATQLLEDKKLSKEYDHSMNLAGNVQQEVRYPNDDLISKEFKPLIDALGKVVHQYISIPPASDTISPAFVGSMLIESMWVVSQWAGDFNPMHVHQGELSGVIYLRVPPSLKDEYAKESIPMLPVTHGVAFTKLQIVLYTIILFIVSVLPYIVLMSGIVYLISAIILSSIFMYYSIKLYLSDDDAIAMKTFNFSIYYIFLIFIALLLDHYLI